MTHHNEHTETCGLKRTERGLLIVLCVLFLLPLYPGGKVGAQEPMTPGATPIVDAELVAVPDSAAMDSLAGDALYGPDTIMTVVDRNPYGLETKRAFNPSPDRAVWLSALFPGLGQIYNRRYWKLPIIVGGFMGLGYATGWNNNQFQDYTQAYRDITDSDPNTNSYMNFFPPTTTEESLDKSWLTQTLKRRKDYYRRNRDLCIICIVALYLVCMVDAYVDASLAHFDISPNLSMDVQPAMMYTPADKKVALGMQWAFTF